DMIAAGISASSVSRIVICIGTPTELPPLLSPSVIPRKELGVAADAALVIRNRRTATVWGRQPCRRAGTGADFSSHWQEASLRAVAPPGMANACCSCGQP